MLRKSLLAAVALMTGTLAAAAADLPSRKAPPVYVPPPPIFTWSGVYIGGQIGYAFGHDNWYDPGTPIGGRYAANGVLGGAHIGYNWQMAQFVFGLEGDVNGTSVSGSQSFAGITFGTRVLIDGSVRGRVGYAFDRALFYATGGAAFGDVRNTYANPFGAPFQSIDHTRVGWTVGGGIEYAVTNNWSVRAEYRYTDYGRYTDPFLGFIPITNHQVENRVTAGFSYKFDMFAPPTPVVAKY
jgi:outer membrane immunogenic protein